MTDYNDDGTRVGDQLEYEFPEMPAQAKSLLEAFSSDMFSEGDLWRDLYR